MHSDHLRLVVCTHQNPAQFLYGTPSEKEIEHNCIEIIDIQTKVREDLVDCPLNEGEILFIDGSSRVVDGKRCSGYSVVDGHQMCVLEKGRLPPTWSAQVCELYALEKALHRLAGSIGTIYTDSRYAYGVVHTFGKIWSERGFLNTKGKDILHKELILKILKALQLPQVISVVHIPGHQPGTTKEARGNNLADLAAKEAAVEEEILPSHNHIVTSTV
ncbi:ribonuclease HI-like [Aphelocoma coerulescens]|uniref:ribonuclease HI-like n=1 Tax=Aphelocoma coerulescens TaxID=39617 RepID=UPI00360530E5